MAIQFNCESCGKRHSIKDHLASKKARCGCGYTMRVPVPTVQANPSYPPLAQQPTQQPAQPTYDDLGIPTQPVVPQTVFVQCQDCGLQYNVPNQLLGQTFHCQCGSPVVVHDMMSSQFDPLQAPHAGQAVSYQFNQPRQPQIDERRAQQQRDDQALAQYIKKDDWREPVDKSKKNYDGFFGPEKKAMEYGVLGGLAMMAVAAVWFFVGFSMGVIFFYPPILFVIGMVAVIVDLIN